MSETPKISVLMSVYNAELYLRESIDSILKQTFTDFEFLIVDDASTDDSLEIITNYQDKRVVLIKNEINIGLTKSLNKGIKLAKGEYIARMDADDISLPERLNKQLSIMENNKKIFICGSWVKKIGDVQQICEYPIEHEEIKAAMLFNSAVAHPSVLIRREVFKKNSYNESMRYAQDYALWVELIHKYRFHNIPEILLKYRVHGQQTNGELQESSANEVRTKMLKNIGLKFNNNQLKMFFAIATFKSVPISNVNLLCLEIINKNSLTHYIDHELLKAKLGCRYWNAINSQSKYNLTLFYSSNKKLLKLGVFTYFKFFIKCLIGYSNQI